MTAQELKDVKIRMKPPLSYYGGKQKLSRDICRALYQSPNWSVKGHYIEPYFGGGAVFFVKEPQRMETINDLNDNLITFYRVIKDPAGFEKVKALLDGTLYSRSEFNRARRILRGEYDASDEAKAWAVFVSVRQGFGQKWLGSWGYAGNKGSGTERSISFQNAVARFTKEYCDRLKNAHIESNDALRVIMSRDGDNAIFYLDPPYAGSVQGYGKFTFGDDDLAALLECMKEIKGYFLLSMYPHPLIEEAAMECGWQTAKKPHFCQVYDGKQNKRKPRTECLTSNYPFYLDGWEIVGQCAERPLPQEAKEERQLELLG